MKKIFQIMLLASLFVFVGCSTGMEYQISNFEENSSLNLNVNKSVEKKEIINETIIKECKFENINKFLNSKFGVNINSENQIKECNYKHLGYGGAYNYSIALNDGTSASLYFSGMGSGGHGSTSYCFKTKDNQLINDVKNQLCSNLRYIKYSNMYCSDEKFDITNETRNLCQNNFFIEEIEDSKILSYSQSESRCGSTIHIGQFSCTNEKMNLEEKKKEFEEIIENLK